MLRKALYAAVVVAVAGVIAFGFGIYVYPVNPALVWTLLMLCWACYRLRMRALSLFSGAEKWRRSPEWTPTDSSKSNTA